MTTQMVCENQTITVKHQGILTVESELGQGSWFAVRLPLFHGSGDGYGLSYGSGYAHARILVQNGQRVVKNKTE
ncbi:hypothetical protein [Synechocystis sp. PCC 7338]|uniref:hypothetical protein n=1 Tax=Synechocystis sp. PCC 7338 TaxID=2732530 RepID=UPI00353024D6